MGGGGAKQWIWSWGSEEGLDALNKHIRETRHHGSMKNITEVHFEDTFNHLWDRSRPTIVELEQSIKKRNALLVVSTEIDTLVEILFLEEE